MLRVVSHIQQRLSLRISTDSSANVNITSAVWIITSNNESFVVIGLSVDFGTLSLSQLF